MLFDFNVYSSLLLLGFLQGVIYVVLLLVRGRREERRSDYWLAFLLLLCCLYIANWMLGFAGWYDAHDWHTTLMFYMPWNQSLLIGPVIYFYFRSLTNNDFRPNRRELLFFLPGVVSLVTYSWAFVNDLVLLHWRQGKPLADFYGTRGPNAQLDLPLLHDPLVEWAWVYGFLLLITRAFGRYRAYIRDNFSNTEVISFSWLRNLLLVLLSGLTVVLVIAVVDAWITPLDYKQFWVGHVAVAIIIYYLSIAGYQFARPARMPLAFSPEGVSLPPLPVAKPEPEPELKAWKRKVEEYMRRERPYLNPNLSLQEMAAGLGTNASVLSRTINQGFGQNFNDFINQRRVEVFKERLAQPDARRLTLLAIALDCGFNSKATFNRAFRKFTGMAPGEFVAQTGNGG